MYYSPNKDMVTIKDLDFSLYLSAREIQNKIRIMATKIASEYEGKNPLLLVVLNGAFIFGADLIRNMDIACTVQFIRLKSYDQLKSTEQLQISGMDKVDVKDRHVIIVEDIIDSGFTMHTFVPLLEEMNPSSIAIASLLMKDDEIKYNVNVKYTGFHIPEKFVVGYGLDYDGQGRNLPHIYQLVEFIE